MKVAVYTQNGTKSKKTVELADNVFDAKIRKDLMAQALYVYNSNQRLGTQKTKSIAEVRGGGRKPWRQKTPDRARHGSTRSPIWVGGGHAHAIIPRNWKKGLSRKMKRLALFSALSLVRVNDALMVVDTIKLDKKQLTKQVAKLWEKLAKDTKTLVIQGDCNRELVLGARSLEKFDVILATELNVYDLLAHDKIIVLTNAVQKINEMWGDSVKKEGDPVIKKSPVVKRTKQTAKKVNKKKASNE